ACVLRLSTSVLSDGSSAASPAGASDMTKSPPAWGSPAGCAAEPAAEAALSGAAPEVFASLVGAAPVAWADEPTVDSGSPRSLPSGAKRLRSMTRNPVAGSDSSAGADPPLPRFVSASLIASSRGALPRRCRSDSGRHARHGAQPGDAVLGRWVRAEEAREAHSGQRVHDEEVSGRGARVQRKSLVRGLELLERRREGERVADGARARLVRRVLAAARDRELDERRGERREDHHGEELEPAAAVALVALHAAEDHRPASHRGEHHDGAGERRRDRRREEVAVLDVREL